MAQHLTKHFVSLSNYTLAAETFTKLRFNHAESSFYVRAFMVVLQELILIRHILVIHLFPERSLPITGKLINLSSSISLAGI
jgi:hypothetical protein